MLGVLIRITTSSFVHTKLQTWNAYTEPVRYNYAYCTCRNMPMHAHTTHSLPSLLSFIWSDVVPRLHFVANLLDGLGRVVGKVEVPHLLRRHRHNCKRLLVLSAGSQPHLGGGGGANLHVYTPLHTCTCTVLNHYSLLSLINLPLSIVIPLGVHVYMFNLEPLPP